ncbi:MAG: hypothetical protein IKH88_09595 [Prevotella sp.]|nr:hypothetical protein [Prevotella sp.]MBR7054663.1 hypothetical protein [Prevotella sp.]
MNDFPTPEVTCDNIVIVDADHIDRVAFDLIVNFERMIGRRIPNADLPRWLDCVALDGGIREGDEVTQVVFIHSRDKQQLEHFTPGGLKDDIDGQAFRDSLGEFVLNTVSEENIVSREDVLLDLLHVALGSKNIKRIVVVPDDDSISQVRHALRKVDDDKRVTLLSMQPTGGGDFKSEILGYSLMSALGIRSEEIPMT